MKKCIVCGDNISTKKKIVCCNNCLTFLKWKYGDDFYPSIIAFRRFEKERFNFNSTKCRRYKK